MADPGSAGPITRWTSRAWNRKAIRAFGALDTADSGPIVHSPRQGPLIEGEAVRHLVDAALLCRDAAGRRETQRLWNPR